MGSWGFLFKMDLEASSLFYQLTFHFFDSLVETALQVSEQNGRFRWEGLFAQRRGCQEVGGGGKNPCDWVCPSQTRAWLESEQKAGTATEQPTAVFEQQWNFSSFS